MVSKAVDVYVCMGNPFYITIGFFQIVAEYMQYLLV